MASESEKRRVWEKGKIVRGRNPNLYRKDYLGNLIYWSSYSQNSLMGWEIDHVNPKNNGGSESIRNKQPLQTRANKEKSDKYPYKRKSLK